MLKARETRLIGGEQQNGSTSSVDAPPTPQPPAAPTLSKEGSKIERVAAAWI